MAHLKAIHDEFYYLNIVLYNWFKWNGLYYISELHSHTTGGNYIIFTGCF